MKIFNQDKTKELNESELDFSLGHLVDDKIVSAHHEATPAVDFKSAVDVAAELKATGKPVIEIDGKPYIVDHIYENGKEIPITPGLDVTAYKNRSVTRIQDLPAQPAKDAYDDYETIRVYIPYTAEELKKIAELKELADLEKWFTEVYDAQVKQYNRCQRLGIQYDNKYGTIAELDNKATANAKRISELRNKYSAK